MRDTRRDSTARPAWLLLLALAVLAPAAAEQPAIVTDEEALFGGAEPAAQAPPSPKSGGLVTVVDEADLAKNIDKTLLVGKGAEIGGEYNFELKPAWTWRGSPLGPENLGSAAYSSALNPLLETKLHFDSRPDENFRVFGKVWASYPFAAPGDWSGSFKLLELFADYNFDRAVFLRAGKQTVKWGVGYFYSPADVLSLAAIDAEKPEDEREGPVALKLHVPVGLDNYYLYLISQNVSTPEAVALAPKAELLIGNLELALAAYYRPDLATRPRAILMATFPFFDLDLFTESVLAYGSERGYVEKGPAGLLVSTLKDELFFQGSLGLRYQRMDGLQGLSLIAQYLFNGLGYQNPSVFVDNPQAVQLLLAQKRIGPADLALRGMHYLSARFSIDRYRESDFGFSLFLMANFSDGSGRLVPELNYGTAKNVTVRFKLPVNYGDPGSEYSPSGAIIAPTLRFDLYERASAELGLPLGFAKAGGWYEWRTLGLAMDLVLGYGKF
jgi:hypothetical protein